jgi:hypothetical protein
MFMRQVTLTIVTGLMLCTLGGCVVHDNKSAAAEAPMWWPAFMVRQNATEDQWGGQSIYGGDRLHISKQGVAVTHAEPVPSMQSLPSAPAQPDMD